MSFWKWMIVCAVVAVMGTYSMKAATPDKVTLKGEVYGMTQDSVQSGKGSRNRFSVAVKFPDNTSSTIELAFDRYLLTKVGDRIQYDVDLPTTTMQNWLSFIGFLEALIGLAAFVTIGLAKLLDL